PLRVAGALGEDADPLADLGRAGLRDARDREAAARRLEDRGQDTDRRRLAGAVRAEDAEDLARVGLEAEIVDGDERPVAPFDASRLDRRVHGPRRGWANMKMPGFAPWTPAIQLPEVLVTWPWASSSAVFSPKYQTLPLASWV